VTVERTLNGWNIQREDFSSSSDSSFRSTVLFVQKNKYSFDSWFRIFITLAGLSRSHLLVHSAGISFRSYTCLFPGRSGRGKSTLIKKVGKQHALSDELVLVSAGGASITASSTPFWGELKRGTGNLFSAPLKSLYFLQRASSASVKKMEQGAALSELLPAVLFFANEPCSVRKVFSLSSRIVRKVPAYSLSFSLDHNPKTILSLIRDNAKKPEAIV
jgi:hypothetical protein